MAILKIIMKAFNKTTREYDKIIYPKTLAELVDTNDGSNVEAELAKKINSTDLTAQFALKSDKTYVDTELVKKSDKTYVDNELVKKSDKGHDHASTYYNKSETDSKLAEKSNTGHGHSSSEAGLGNVDNVKQMPLSGSTFTGQAKAQNNTAYGTFQLRNIGAGTGTPSGGGNGDVYIKYKA